MTPGRGWVTRSVSPFTDVPANTACGRALLRAVDTTVDMANLRIAMVTGQRVVTTGWRYP